MFLSDVEEGTSPSIIEAPQIARKGQQFDVIVKGTNERTTTLLVSCSVAVDKTGDLADGFSINPSVTEARVEPGGSYRFSFQLQPSERLPDHLFHLKAFLSMNGAVAWALKKIQILG